MLRKTTKCLILAVVLAALAGPATAERRWFVSGTVDDYDSDALTVEVATRTIQLTTRTRIKREDGSLGDFSDVEDRDGEHVDVLVTRGHPHPVAETVLLVDPDEDE